jgi:hypothetical protein
MTPFLHCKLLRYTYHAHNSGGPYLCCPLPRSKRYISPAHHWLPQSHHRQAAWNIAVHSGRSNYRHSMVSELPQASVLKTRLLGLCSHFQHSASTICTAFKTLRSAHTVCLCVLCGSENNQRLFHCTALTGWVL